MTSLKLTRESILKGDLLTSARELLGTHTLFMTAEERERQVDEIIAQAPRRDRVWLFAYGSLMWNPAFHFAEQRPALVHGYHRQFCLWAKAGRGSPSRPGLVLALERGGSCHGIAYRLHRNKVRSELDIVWRREMLTMAYRPVWVTVRMRDSAERAIAFAANRSHERYVRGLDTAAVVGYLASGAGPLGRCRDYLFDSVKHLRDLGIRDRHLEALAHAVARHEAGDCAA